MKRRCCAGRSCRLGRRPQQQGPVITLLPATQQAYLLCMNACTRVMTKTGVQQQCRDRAQRAVDTCVCECVQEASGCMNACTRVMREAACSPAAHTSMHTMRWCTSSASVGRAHACTSSSIQPRSACTAPEHSAAYAVHSATSGHMPLCHPICTRPDEVHLYRTQCVVDGMRRKLCFRNSACLRIIIMRRSAGARAG